MQVIKFEPIDLRVVNCSYNCLHYAEIAWRLTGALINDTRIVGPTECSCPRPIT